jgi:hypothetical protein
VTLRYEDALRIAGDRNPGFQDKWAKITRGLELGASVGAPTVLGWLASTSEFVKLSGDLVRYLSERHSGLSRHSRTQRLEAAHAIIVVASYFESLSKADFPFRFKEIKLTKAEELAIATAAAQIKERSRAERGDTAEDKERKALEDARRAAVLGARFVDRVLALGASIPEPHISHDAYMTLLSDYYKDLSTRARHFIEGLAVFDTLGGTAQHQLRRELEEEVPARALRRYGELFARLVKDCPELGYWAGLREHRATRAEVGQIAGLLERLEHIIEKMSISGSPSRQVTALARIHRALLDEPILDSSDSPAGLRIPTLREAYLPPRFRLAEVSPTNPPSNESWWEKKPVRHDLEYYLAAYLTSPRATRAPLLVLGQPGSGKTVLTRMLAASLPASDFLPVRVVLRNTWKTDSIQDQIEWAMKSDTRFEGDWPALVESAGQALPVILLDGFDELLQVTGTSQSDYLERVSNFQRREANHGRPVAVVVTTRSSVANRARAPHGTLAMHLEPLDGAQIEQWLEKWNEANERILRARNLSCLPLDVVLAHKELAEQPLLLLMLAIYDGHGNVLQSGTAGLHRYELYEKMLYRFAEWQARKLEPGLSDDELGSIIEDELRRLAIVAFAMYNRGSQWVREVELDRDLQALLGLPAQSVGREYRSIKPSVFTLGRFFFVHRAAASVDDVEMSTYEFLHATFGEFLIARLTWQALSDFAAREKARTIYSTRQSPNDELLHAVLSFAPLSNRGQILAFFAEMTSQARQSEREFIGELLKRAFVVVHQPRPASTLGGYRPLNLSVPALHACYSANLLLLILHVAGEVRASDLLFGGQNRDVASAWRSQALLWRSQLAAEEWNGLIATVAVDRIWDGGWRDLRIFLDDGSFKPPSPERYWSLGVPPGDPLRNKVDPLPNKGEYVRRNANFVCDADEDEAAVRYTLHR